MILVLNNAQLIDLQLVLSSFRKTLILKTWKYCKESVANLSAYWSNIAVKTPTPKNRCT